MGNLESIADIQPYTVIEKIAEGCSGDEKYKLEKDGKYFLLRVGDRSKSSERKKEFDRLKAYADRDINTHRPVMFGTVNDRFYSVVTWVSGTPIMDIIKKDVSKSYYSLGRKVGIELQKLHAASQTDRKIDWQKVIEESEDIESHVFNANRILKIFGENFELDLPQQPTVEF